MRTLKLSWERMSVAGLVAVMAVGTMACEAKSGTKADAGSGTGTGAGTTTGDGGSGTGATTAGDDALVLPDVGTTGSGATGDATTGGTTSGSTGDTSPPKDTFIPNQTDTGGGTGKPQTCGQFYPCAQKCPANDEPCQTACAEDLSQAEQDKIGAFELCKQKSGCTTSACIFEKCITEFAGCFAGGKDTCIQILQCAVGCKADAACQNSCLEKGSTEGLTIFIEEQACLSKECPDNASSCLQAAATTGACKALFEKCTGATSTGNECKGTGTCTAMNTCIVGCGADAKCQTACTEAASDAACKAFAAVQLCFQEQCPTGDAACVKESQGPGKPCADEVATCAGAPKPGAAGELSLLQPIRFILDWLVGAQRIPWLLK